MEHGFGRIIGEAPRDRRSADFGSLRQGFEQLADAAVIALVRDDDLERGSPMHSRSKFIPWRATVFAVVALALVGSVGRAQRVATPAAFSESDTARATRQWFPTPSILPGGGRLAIVSGNPLAPGRFTLEFEMPDGYILPPHTNPSNERVLVRSGAFMVGTGLKIDREKSVLLTVGDTASVPAGVPHWSIARGDTRLIITEAMGPYGIAYMSVRDEPGSHAFPSGYNR